VERLHELDFEITTQMGRVRGINYSLPYLALPWTLNHIINEKSPLYGISPDSWHDPRNEFELIVVLDGVDEGVSMNVQARWSYLPSEIIWGARFTNIIKRNRARSVFEVDYSQFSSIEYVDFPIKSVVVAANSSSVNNSNDANHNNTPPTTNYNYNPNTTNDPLHYLRTHASKNYAASPTNLMI
jgi:hypothetical protein